MDLESGAAPLYPTCVILAGQQNLRTPNCVIISPFNAEKKVKGATQLSAYFWMSTQVILCTEVKADIEQFLAKARDADCPWSGARIIGVHVRRNINLAEAPSYGKTIFEYEPKCHGAADYKTVAEYIHSQTGAQPEPDISKQPAIPIQELGPVKKVASTLADEVVEKA